MWFGSVLLVWGVLRWYSEPSRRDLDMMSLNFSYPPDVRAFKIHPARRNTEAAKRLMKKDAAVEARDGVW